jgi:hypothetical protein
MLTPSAASRAPRPERLARPEHEARLTEADRDRQPAQVARVPSVAITTAQPQKRHDNLG